MAEEKLTYEGAAAELEEILEALQSDDIGIDQLAEKVARAKKLLEFCNQKLRDTEQAVGKIIEDLDL